MLVVAAVAKASGIRAADVEKRAILERLIGEITVTPYFRKGELELQFALVAEALPSVIPASRANAYYRGSGGPDLCCSFASAGLLLVTTENDNVDVRSRFTRIVGVWLGRWHVSGVQHAALVKKTICQ
jgi:hypothetical protein